jgi:hypothetical protein
MYTLRWIGSAFLVLLGLLLIAPGLIIAIATDWQPTRTLREDEVARIRAASAFVEINKTSTGRLPTTDEFKHWAESAPSQLRLDGVGFTYLPHEENDYIFDWYGGRGAWLSWKSHTRADLANISSRYYFIFGSKWADLLVFFGLGAAALWARSWQLRTVEMQANSATHPEPLKRRTVSFPSSRRPGGRER